MCDHQTNHLRARMPTLVSGEAAGSVKVGAFSVSLATESHSPGLSETPPLHAPAPRDLSDEELILEAQGGITSAFDELVARHRPLVYRAARRFAKDAEEADDLFQESMLRAFMGIGKFRMEARFSSWLVAIVVNAALSIRRKERRIRWIYLDENDGRDDRIPALELPDVRSSPEQEYLRQELHFLLRREVLEQDPKYRFILWACDLRELPVEEAARVLGISGAAAKSRLHRARKMILHALRRRTDLRRR